jgi:hypothetical protein
MDNYALVSNFRSVLNIVSFLLGNSPPSEFYMPTFRNTLFHLHRQVGVSIPPPLVYRPATTPVDRLCWGGLHSTQGGRCELPTSRPDRFEPEEEPRGWVGATEGLDLMGDRKILKCRKYFSHLLLHVFFAYHCV